MMRLSVGIEEVRDMITDLDQAIAAAHGDKFTGSTQAVAAQ